MSSVFYVVDSAGNRLCQDGYLRGFALGGSFPECVKGYVTKGRALNAARKIKGAVLEISGKAIPNGDYPEMDAAGYVSNGLSKSLKIIELLNGVEYRGFVIHRP